MPLSNTIWDFFQAWTILFKSYLFSCIRNIIPTSVLWSIWWECNKRIFRKVSSSIENVCIEIEKSVSELVNVYVQSHHKCNLPFTSWYGSFLKEWKSICIPPIGNMPPHLCNIKSDRSLTIWLPSVQDYVKLNFDGSSRDNLGISGVGDCIRNHLGELVAFKFSSLSQGTNNISEA